MFFITLNEILFIVNASWLCLAINSKFNLSLVLFLILLSGSFVFFCSLWRGIKEWQNILVMLKLPWSVLWSAALALGFLLVGEEPSFNTAYIGFADVWGRCIGSLALLGGHIFLRVPHAWKTSRKKCSMGFKPLESRQSPSPISALGTFCSLLAAPSLALNQKELEFHFSISVIFI